LSKNYATSDKKQHLNLARNPISFDVLSFDAFSDKIYVFLAALCEKKIYICIQ